MANDMKLAVNMEDIPQDQIMMSEKSPEAYQKYIDGLDFDKAFSLAMVQQQRRAEKIKKQMDAGEQPDSPFNYFMYKGKPYLLKLKDDDMGMKDDSIESKVMDKLIMEDTGMNMFAADNEEPEEMMS